jgi:hypothetical protein
VVNLRKAEPPIFNISANLRNFAINLLPGFSCLRLEFDSVKFESKSGGPLAVDVKLDHVRFKEALSFVQDLAESMNPKNGPFLDIQPSGITAGFRLSLPNLTIGALNIYDLRFYTGAAISFSGAPMRMRFGVSDSSHPFMLTVGILGGGGYFNLELDANGLQRLEAALEFGAQVELDLAVAKGQGYILAGIYYGREISIVNGRQVTQSKLVGFVRAGGELSILGMMSMSLELYVELGWQSSGRVHGKATIRVEIHMLFFHVGVDVSAEYTFVGSQSSVSDYLAADRSVGPGARRETPCDSLVSEPIYASSFDWDLFNKAFHE